MDAGSKLNLVSFGGAEFYIGGELKTLHPKYPIPAFLIASSEAKKITKPFGAYISIKKGLNNKKSTVQALFSDTQTAKKAPIGSLSVLLNASKWPNYNNKKTSVLILSVDKNTKTNYWICAISPSGHIIQQFERLCDNVYDIPSVLAEIELTETPHYFYEQNDVAISTLLEQHKEDYGSDLTVDAIPSALIKTSISDNKALFKQLYRQSQVELKKAGAAFAIASIAIAGAFSYGYLNTQGSVSWLTSSEIDAEITKSKNRLQALSSEFKPSKNWTPINYKETTVEQFVSTLGDLSSPPEITMMLKKIEDIMPIYAMDWTMAKINYVNGDFLVYYTRDKAGKGVYFLLDEVISNIQKNNPEIKIEGFALVNSAQERVYKISSKNSATGNLEGRAILDVLSKEKAHQNSLRRAVQNALNDFSDAEKIRQEFNSVTFLNRWFTEAVNDLKIQSEEKLNAAKLSFDRSEKLYSEINNMERSSIKEEWVLGSVLEFVVLMQTDSLFTWSYPELIRTYPDSATLKEKAEKKKRSNKRTKGKTSEPEIYGPAIETYSVTVSTQSSDEIGKIVSYGVLDMIQLSILIDRPFISVEQIEYDPKTEQWSLVLTFNRKTPEFDKRIALQ